MKRTLLLCLLMVLCTKSNCAQSVAYTLPLPNQSSILSDDRLAMTKLFAPIMNGTLNELPIILPFESLQNDTFLLHKSTLLTPFLQSRFPSIGAFTGYSKNNKQHLIALTYYDGLVYIMVRTNAQTHFINPVISGYQLITKSQMVTENYWSCQYHDDLLSDNSLPEFNSQDFIDDNPYKNVLRTNGTYAKIYRLALACTGEYAARVSLPNAPNVTDAFAAMTVTINRVNMIYNAELAIGLEFIDSIEKLIQLNPSTDPYTNGNEGLMLRENQNHIDSVIGSANYDIGHVFGTGGGGVANLGSVCDARAKAMGVTTSNNPVGDPFDIDYVAHEMGHQFGANHTFNSNQSGCGGGNRSNNNAYEPGSGSTIMSYAGLCGNDNLQYNSDPYFHTRSLDAITVFINNRNTGGACGRTTDTINTPPLVASIAKKYYIPSLTPFYLESTDAVDTNTDGLTYCWDQFNRGDYGKTLAATKTAGPLFRSRAPEASPRRYFPQLSAIQQGKTIIVGEKLPDTTRKLTFRLTVRDIFNGWGSHNTSADSVEIFVEDAGVGFTLLSHQTSTSKLHVGYVNTVQWERANTHLPPINCDSVVIYLSVDAGATWHQKLGVFPNTGTADVFIPMPSQLYDSCRLVIMAKDNIFFNMNRRNLPMTTEKQSVDDPNGFDNLIKLYPNPAEDFLILDIETALKFNYQFSIYNMLGQRLFELRSDEFHVYIPVHNLPPGQYISVLKSEDGMTNRTMPFLKH
jgi:hypothetical protein